MQPLISCGGEAVARPVRSSGPAMRPSIRQNVDRVPFMYFNLHRFVQRRLQRDHRFQACLRHVFGHPGQFLAHLDFVEIGASVAPDRQDQQLRRRIARAFRSQQGLARMTGAVQSECLACRGPVADPTGPIRLASSSLMDEPAHSMTSRATERYSRPLFIAVSVSYSSEARCSSSRVSARCVSSALIFASAFSSV